MNLRVIAGFVLAPLIPCALFNVVMSVVSNQWSGLGFGIVAMVAVSEVLSIFVAVPLYFVLRRFRSIGALECTLSGVAVTVLLNVAFLIFTPGPGFSAADSEPTVIDGFLTTHGYVSALFATAIQSVLGAAIGLCFWIIAIRRLPHADTNI
jgi:hypothetical protein